MITVIHILCYQGRPSKVINGLPAPTHLPATPPISREGDRAILVHLLVYEDWSPSSPNSGSRTSSYHGSLGPRFVPFNWARSVLAGKADSGQAHLFGGCHPRPPRWCDGATMMMTVEDLGCSRSRRSPPGSTNSSRAAFGEIATCTHPLAANTPLGHVGGAGGHGHRAGCVGGGGGH